MDDSCVFVLNLRSFIEGFYSGNETMRPVFANAGMSQNMQISDSITVELYDALSPSTILLSYTAIINISGYAIIYIPTSFSGATVYISVKHRNAIETWSKLPVTISANNTYDFTH